MAKKQQIKYQFKIYRNKSRQGRYIQIKQKGKPTGLYKIDEDTKLDVYKNYYIDKHIKKRKNITIQQYKKAYKEKTLGIKTKKRTRPVRSAEQYIARLKRKGYNIERNLKGGIGKTTIKNAYATNPNKIKKHTKELLKYNVLDKELLELIATEENIEKIKHRLEYIIEIKGRDGETLATARTHNKTPKKVINELKRNIKPGEKVEEKSPNKIRDIFKALHYKGYRHQSEGKVQKINIEIIFRKRK